MTEATNIFAIIDELRENAKTINDEDLKAVEKLITEAKRIFIGGAGRSGFPENKIGSMADATIKIPGVTEKVEGKGKASVQASGSSFEELSWITYDAMVMDLMKITNQTDKDLFKRHANME